MPCGGIYTAATMRTGGAYPHDVEWCGHCNQRERDGRLADHYVEEWDGVMVHAACIPEYLINNVEGRGVNSHKHFVEVDGVTLYEEGQDR